MTAPAYKLHEAPRNRRLPKPNVISDVRTVVPWIASLWGNETRSAVEKGLYTLMTERDRSWFNARSQWSNYSWMIAALNRIKEYKTAAFFSDLKKLYEP